MCLNGRIFYCLLLLSDKMLRHTPSPLRGTPPNFRGRAELLMSNGLLLSL